MQNLSYELRKLTHADFWRTSSAVSSATQTGTGCKRLVTQLCIVWGLASLLADTRSKKTPETAELSLIPFTKWKGLAISTRPTGSVLHPPDFCAPHGGDDRRTCARVFTGVYRLFPLL